MWRPHSINNCVFISSAFITNAAGILATSSISPRRAKYSNLSGWRCFEAFHGGEYVTHECKQSGRPGHSVRGDQRNLYDSEETRAGGNRVPSRLHGCCEGYRESLFQSWFEILLSIYLLWDTECWTHEHMNGFRPHCMSSLESWPTSLNRSSERHDLGVHVNQQQIDTRPICLLWI